MSFICNIHNYTEYNQQWNVFSAFNPSKCTHTWSSGHTHTHLEQWTHTHTHLEQWADSHTPGAVDTHTHTWSSGHTHTHTWSSGHTHTHTHTPGAVDTHTHTHLEQWADSHTPGAVGSPGSSWGFGALLKGLSSVVDSQPQSFLLLCIEKLHLTERQLFYNRTLKSHCETEYSQIHAKSVIDGQKK